MFSILANPIEVKPENLKLLATANYLTTKHCSAMGRSTINQDQNGGFGFGDILETVGATVINGYMAVLGNPDCLRTGDFAAQAIVNTYNNRTTSFRMAMPIPCKTGKTITGFSYEYLRIQSGSGVTATITATLKKMAANGTLTQIATASFGTTANGTQYVTLANSGTPTVMNEGDRLIMEVQMAPLSGTHNTTNYCYAYFLASANNQILQIF